MNPAPHAQRAFLAIGSNLGDRAAYLHQAVCVLSNRPGISVERVSRFHETAPVGGPRGQRPYFNAVVEINTTLSPEELLDACGLIEAAAGRERRTRWGPRTLDIDILMYGECVIETDRLTVPHPRMHERAFVLEPLCEIAPGVVHAVLGRTVQDLLRQLRADA